MDFKRVIVIVLDGVGAGAAPDAAAYGDEGSNSLGNTARVVGGIDLPNFEKLGMGHITPMQGVEPVANPTGAFGKMQPKSAGKDTISGHWEMMGVYLADPLPTYPNGFPQYILDEFKKRTGYDVLANIPASGTEIIQKYGMEHMQTGKPIVYTSADSVFQIAAHEEVIPLERLYEICKIAREILTGKDAVGRVIARPFLGNEPGKFYRTEHRHDYPLIPPTQTVLEKLVESGREVYSVGKIDDIFACRGITKSNHTTNNQDSIQATLDILPLAFEGMVFVNLIEFDMIYGHRNDAPGYAGALKRVDDAIPAMLERMHPDDIIIFAADHGVDPTTPSTDHSREYVPLLAFGPKVKPVNLGTRKTFGDLGQTILDNFSLPPNDLGTSFLKEIK